MHRVPRGSVGQHGAVLEVPGAACSSLLALQEPHGRAGGACRPCCVGCRCRWSSGAASTDTACPWAQCGLRTSGPRARGRRASALSHCWALRVASPRATVSARPRSGRAASLRPPAPARLSPPGGDAAVFVAVRRRRGGARGDSCRWHRRCRVRVTASARCRVPGGVGVTACRHRRNCVTVTDGCRWHGGPEGARSGCALMSPACGCALWGGGSGCPPSAPPRSDPDPDAPGQRRHPAPWGHRGDAQLPFPPRHPPGRRHVCAVTRLPGTRGWRWGNPRVGGGGDTGPRGRESRPRVPSDAIAVTSSMLPPGCPR